MINYKKSLLSVAAAAAITATSLSAGYLPLTSDSNDNEWVIFGVSGVKTDGAVATVPGAFSIAADGTNDTTDLLADEIETANANALYSVKAITDADVEVRIDVSGVTYLESDPVRTIYVDSSGDNSPNFAVSYKSSLEAKKLEYAIGGGNAYDLNISYENVFDNPVDGNEITGVPAVDGNELVSLTETDSVVDYDFSNNPPVSDNWAALDGHRDNIATNGGNELRVYQYIAAESKWEIYDSRNTANDFDEITAGKAYWARLDSEDDGNNDNGALEAGLVLGTPGLTDADYTAAGLEEGWNFISFDGVNSQIRNSAVGMLLTTSTSGAAATWTITDSSGNHSIDIAAVGAGDSNIVVAKTVNNSVAQAKLLGTLPNNFEIRAYPSAAAGQIILLANKKFIVTDGAADELDAATTLTGDVLLNPNTLIDHTTGLVTALLPVMTKYGEYAMVVEPLVGAGSAQGLSNSPASVEVIGDTTTSTLNYGVGAAGDTVTEVTAVLTAHADITATEIDLGIDGTTEEILMASTAPFRLRDHTFTRVFDFVTQGATASQVDISVGPINNTVIPTATANADAVATIIDGVGGAATFSADSDDGVDGNVIIVTDTAGAAKFTVLEHEADLLQVSTSSTDLAKGAVKNVYSLNYLSKIDARNDVTFTFLATTFPDNAADDLAFGFTDTLGTATVGTTIQPNSGALAVNTLTNNTTVITAIITQLNTDLAAAGLDATATAVIDDAVITNSVITISGPDIAAGTMDYTTGGGAAEVDLTGTPDVGFVAAYSGDLSKDLKYNSELTPNYVMNGPLYTMRDNNMTLKALVTGTTDITDGSVSWESVDLTRNPSEWLTSQDYDLFDTDASAGYWAYLTPDTTNNPLSITSATLSKEYVHHFDEVIATTTGTTTNEFSGNLEVIVAGLSAADNYLSSRVTATVGGETFELTQDGVDKTKFTGSVSVHESYLFNTGTAYDVIINVADGLGNNLTETKAILDNVKPGVPTVVSAGGTITVSTDPADGVTGIYIFGGTPTEVGTEAAKQGYISGSGGTASAACQGAASAWDDTAGGITIFSMDGNGTIGLGNASNTANVAFMPIMISRVLMTDTAPGGIIDSATGGDDYNATCDSQGPLTVNTGVTLTALTADTTVKMAYTSQGEDSGNEIPVTMYVVNGGGGTQVKAEMKYPANYAGTDVFFEIGGSVYGYQLPTEAALDAANNSDANPIDLDAADVTNPKTGISL